MTTAKASVAVLLAILGVSGPAGAALAATPTVQSPSLNFNLTVTKGGSGSGTVASNVGAIDCGAACSDTFPAGTPVTLTATPGGGSQFTGWLGPCTGQGTCQFTINGATTAVATFAPTSLGPPRLDVDGTASSDALTDGLLILRYLFGLSGASLINSAVGPGATRTAVTQIGDYLTNIRPALDIDGNGESDALTDGLMIIRYLFGLRGSGLVAGAVGPGAIRATAPVIEAYLQMFFAAVIIDPPVFSGSFVAPERAALTTLPLPPMTGRPGVALLILPDGTFYFDPAERTPVAAAAECAAVVLSCFSPGVRNWAGCLANVPQCATGTPWVGDNPMCCAPACSARYQELRVAGESGPSAFVKGIFRAPSCMPGVVGYVPAGQP